MPFPGKDNISGWGVIRMDPWDFAGVFEFREQAEARSKEKGDGYIVRYGDHAVGSTDFVWSESA